MSTQIEQVPGGWVISTLIREGSQRKIPRKAVIIMDPSLTAMRAEVERQAQEARTVFGVQLPQSEPVD